MRTGTAEPATPPALMVDKHGCALRNRLYELDQGMWPSAECPRCFFGRMQMIRSSRLKPNNNRSGLCRASKKRGKISLDASIAALAIPALGTELIDPLLSACDTAFVGRIGPQPLAGVGIASSVFTYTFLFFNFLSTASSPLITQALARSVLACITEVWLARPPT